MAAGHFSLILAAGKGTRMHSIKPKVLHTLLGEPMLALVLRACRQIFGKNILVVAGHRAELLRKAFPDENFVEQTEQLGTGHALQIALPALEASGATRLTILNGDAPLITAAVLNSFLGAAKSFDLAFATIALHDPAAYGRVTRSPQGRLAAIVEANDYDVEKLGEPSGEVNAGIYDMDIDKFRPLIAKLSNNNRSGEYYLTDLVALGLEAGLNVDGIPCGDHASLLGVNSPAELAEAEDLLAARVNASLLADGVLLHNPSQARISPMAVIEPGAEIFGPCEILGATHIHSGAIVEAFCTIRQSQIHSKAVVHQFSCLDGADVGERALVGPYTRLRPGACLCPDSHAGNFVELKKARLGAGSKANHLSYLGDADIGPGTNIGAGTITCNYDGENKHQTKIGANAFIGSNTALVAPVSVGSGALIGAGSVITKDVDDGNLAVARSKQKNLLRRKK